MARAELCCTPAFTNEETCEGIKTTTDQIMKNWECQAIPPMAVLIGKGTNGRIVGHHRVHEQVEDIRPESCDVNKP